MRVFKLIERNTGKKYAAVVQAVDLNFDGYYTLRYCVGVMNYQGFHGDFCVYDNDEFNARFKVDCVEWWDYTEDDGWFYKCMGV